MREGEGGEGGAAGVKQVSHLAYEEVHDTNNHLVGKWLVRKEEEKEKEEGKKGWGAGGVEGSVAGSAKGVNDRYHAISSGEREGEREGCPYLYVTYGPTLPALFSLAGQLRHSSPAQSATRSSDNLITPSLLPPLLLCVCPGTRRTKE